MDPKSFLAGIKTEGLIEAEPSKPDEQGKETPAASPAEKKPEDAPKPEPKPAEAADPAKPEGTDAAAPGGDKPADPKPESPQAQDEQLPFHKHPRWKRLNDINKTLVEQNAQMNERIAALEGEREAAKKGEVPPIPEWFSNQFGDDEDAWRDFLDTVDKRAGKGDEPAKPAAKPEAAADDDKKWEAWVDDELDKLEDDPGVGKFDRNKLMLIAAEYLPTDENGDISLRKALDIMRNLEKGDKAKADDKIEARKKAASAAAPSPAPAKADDKKVMTSKDVRGKSFRKLLLED